MADLNLILSVLLSLFGIILLIVLIILALRMIRLVDRADKFFDNMEAKVNSLDGLFMVMNRFSDGLSTITENLVFSVVNSIARVFSRNHKKEDNHE